MTTSATPREFGELMEQLEHLPHDRAAAIARMIFEIVGICPVCDERVRRCDQRVVVDHDDQCAIAHLACVSDAGTARVAPREGGGREVSGG